MLCDGLGSQDKMFPLPCRIRSQFTFRFALHHPVPKPKERHFPNTMRFYHLVLLMVAVLFASAGPTSAYRRSKLTTPGTQTQVLQDNTPAKRLLRAYTDDEERGISIPGLESALKVFPSSKTNQLQGLLKADGSIDDAFKTLGLSKCLLLRMILSRRKWW
ncbi:RxLR effector protein [Phytophthora ramorum]|uniref:RxLR effector protein n=1 Tax=Phytophthora ramorum TaxID=164328 RepID=UPI0030A2BBE9|nr:RxLR effector protein [Phytophthora ramorum]KAH7496135.1 RxLR effector protein [Phytophthora ramorum]